MRQRDLDRYNRESEQAWRRKYEHVPAKVGTIPMMVWIDKATAEQVMSGTMQRDERIVWCESENGQRQTGLVEEIRIGLDGQLTLC